MNKIDTKKLVNLTKDINILYVEDNDDTRESTLLVFKELFNRVFEGYDGVNGLEVFKENCNEIELIITDINMPRCDGIEMAKEILKIKDTHIILLTAHDEFTFFQKSLEINVDGYLLKPFNISQLLPILKKTVDKINLKKQNKKYMTLLKQYEDITNKSSIVSKTDLKGNITYVNQTFCEISGYKESELIGQPHNIVRHPDVPKSVFRELWNTIQDKKIWQGVVKNRTKAGNSYYVKATVSPILDTNGNIIEYIAVRHDIGEIINDKKQLLDFLENNKFSAIMLIQIEEYNILEKFYNGAIVEEIENSFAVTLMNLIPKELCFKRVYRLGEGIYAFAQSRKICQLSKDEFSKYISILLDKIKKHVVRLENIEYDISVVCSFTFGVFKIYEDAKAGIEKAIKEHKSIVYADGLYDINYEKAKQNIKMIRFIKNAIENDRITSYFQPIVNNKTLEVEKYESLIRLVDCQNNVLSPYYFLDVARKGRYYQKITEITLANSFEALNHVDKDISINISVKDILSKEIRDKIYELLKRYEIFAHRIVFELLESEDVKDMDSIKKFIKLVKQKGVQIAIDDFGAGYSNYERILIYEPDILKIDGSLIKNIITKKLSQDIVETIILFAKRQNLKIVAEYIENEEIQNRIKTLGIEYSQGYYFGRPESISFYKNKLS